MEDKSILVLGSIAYDFIMNFEGDFNDNLTSNKLNNVFNLAVMPNSKIMSFGGTSGNISYNLAQLNAKTVVITSVGNDFIDLGYQNRINELTSIEFRGDIHKDSFTASCYIVNDKNHNQLIIFHEGSMKFCPEIDLKKKNLSSEKIKIASISPDNVNAMMKWANQLNDLKIDYIFDPGQVTPAFDKTKLNEIIPKAFLIIGNEFEIKMIIEKMEIELDDLLKINPNIIITLGENGSKCYCDGEIHEISCCKPDNISDTTGAGDGFRAGLLHGLANGLSIPDSCKIGSVTSSYVIESIGPQTQKYNIENVRMRYEKTFSKKYPL